MENVWFQKDYSTIICQNQGSWASFEETILLKKKKKKINKYIINYIITLIWANEMLLINKNGKITISDNPETMTIFSKMKLILDDVFEIIWICPELPKMKLDEFVLPP